MVAQSSLEALVMVRIHVGQPLFSDKSLVFAKAAHFRTNSRHLLAHIYKYLHQLIFDTFVHLGATIGNSSCLNGLANLPKPKDYFKLIHAKQIAFLKMPNQNIIK